MAPESGTPTKLIQLHPAPPPYQFQHVGRLTLTAKPTYDWPRYLLGYTRLVPHSAFARQPGELLRSPARAGIHDDVYQGGLAGIERAFKSRPDLVRLLYVFSVAAERLHHQVEPHARSEVVWVLLTVHVFTDPLVYVGVLEYDPDDRQLESHCGLDVHAVEAEGPVALQADHGLVRVNDLGGD